MREHLESYGDVRSLDDFYQPLTGLFRPLHKLSSVSTIGPDLLQAWKTIPEFLKHQLRPISILDIRRMNHTVQDQAEGVDDEMALPALDFLACIVALGTPFSVVLAL